MIVHRSGWSIDLGPGRGCARTRWRRLQRRIINFVETKDDSHRFGKTSGQGGKLPGALPAVYTTLLAGLKARIRAARLRAVVSVNRGLILLYWDIGKIIVEALDILFWLP
jgi:hypothetical protein